MSNRLCPDSLPSLPLTFAARGELQSQGAVSSCGGRHLSRTRYGNRALHRQLVEPPVLPDAVGLRSQLWWENVRPKKTSDFIAKLRHNRADCCCLPESQQRTPDFPPKNCDCWGNPGRRWKWSRRSESRGAEMSRLFFNWLPVNPRHSDGFQLFFFLCSRDKILNLMLYLHR